MLELLKEDYAKYMSDYTVYDTVHHFLLESRIRFKSFEEICKLLDVAYKNHHNNRLVVEEIKVLSLKIIGRDIYKEEIGIVDGHNSSSYFWIMPVRVIDSSNTAEIDNVAEMRSAEISIEENDVGQYLTPFLYKHFDDALEANRRRVEYYSVDDNGNEKAIFVDGFEWNLTYNFFTYDQISLILKDISDTVEALSYGRENEFTSALEIESGMTTPELVIDFYHRFLYRMEYMMKVGKENGYNLISFMGP